MFTYIVQSVSHTCVLALLREALEGVCVGRGGSSPGCLSWHFISVLGDNTHSLRGLWLSCLTRTQLHTHTDTQTHTHAYTQCWRVDLPHCQVQLTATAASACPLCLVKINLPTNFLIKFHHNPWGVIGSLLSSVWCCDVRLLQQGAVIQLDAVKHGFLSFFFFFFFSCERKKNDPSAFPAVC